MHAPGVEVRPLRQMTGGASFNEVFFTDVRVPDSHRLGEVNGGWTVALTTLMNERAAIGGGGGRASGYLSSNPADRAGPGHRPADDPLVRQQLATIIINERVARYTNLRAMAKIAVGQLPGPEMSMAKLSLTANMVRTCELVSSLLGPALVADTGAWGTYAWSEFLLGVPGMRMAGGTDEVLHNIIGERVLGPAQGARPQLSDVLAEGQLVDERPRPPVQRGEAEPGQRGAVHRRGIALVAIEVEAGEAR